MQYKYDVAIIGGLGHIGLPLGILFASKLADASHSMHDPVSYLIDFILDLGQFLMTQQDIGATVLYTRVFINGCGQKHSKSFILIIFLSP